MAVFRNFESVHMKKKKLASQFLKVGGGMAVMALAPGTVWGCACGCGIFEVGTSAMFPEGSGGMAFQTYAFQNQNQNSNIPPPLLPIVSPEPITNEPPTTTSNTKPRSWLDDIRDSPAGILKVCDIIIL